MFCSSTANNKINMLHERALRIVYDDYNSKFEQLLTKDVSFAIHHLNIQTLVINLLHETLNRFSQVFFSRFVS